MDILCRKLGSEALTRLSWVLADAFQEDPLANAIFKNHNEIQALMLFMLKYFNRCGEIHYVDDFSGVAVWLPPGVPFLSISDALTTRMLKDFLPALGSISWRSLFHMSHFSFYVSAKHPHEVHYYLFAIGVRSDKEGQGIGKQLMQYAINKFGDGQLYYLENSNRKNLHFYHGFKFSVDSEGELRGAKLFFMTRRENTSGRSCHDRDMENA